MANEATSTRVQEAVGYLDFPKDLTVQDRDGVLAAYNTLIRAHVRILVLNFKETHFINSGGMGLIMSLVEEGRQTGCQICALGLDSYHQRIFRIIGLAERLTWLTDEADAVKLVTK
jgi:anti-anti-sigma factor